MFSMESALGLSGVIAGNVRRVEIYASVVRPLTISAICMGDEYCAEVAALPLGHTRRPVRSKVQGFFGMAFRNRDVLARGMNNEQQFTIYRRADHRHTEEG